jgi:hypothetical protein
MVRWFTQRAVVHEAGGGSRSTRWLTHGAVADFAGTNPR